MKVMKPLISKFVDDTRTNCARARVQGKSIGLVPTMGALHEGHASLIRMAVEETDFVAVSIFVNPTQFGPNEDLEKYPRTWDADVELCRSLGVDLIFAPDVSEMYPPHFTTFVEVHQLKDKLCGKTRPIHFRGVTTVVLKLFHILSPSVAFFGQKDAQQVRIIQQMVTDLNVPVQIRVGPTIREADGLAMSSRNKYLSPDERHNATVLFQSLAETEAKIDKGVTSVKELRAEIISKMEQTPGAKLDYCEIVDFTTLEPVAEVSGEVLIALAVYFGNTRLIDNLIVRC